MMRNENLGTFSLFEAASELPDSHGNARGKAQCAGHTNFDTSLPGPMLPPLPAAGRCKSPLLSSLSLTQTRCARRDAAGPGADLPRSDIRAKCPRTPNEV